MSEIISNLYPAYQTDNSKYQDYVGFIYNNIHSSELGIKRTSDGSRFNENLLPSFQDKTVQIPGGDGTYYFGSYFTHKQFNISFAFDSLNEAGVQRLKAVFGDKKIHDLIFDETPYKVYRAKVTGTATIKYIAFDEGESNRTYKGEGTINFTCYQPFARSRFKKIIEVYKKDESENFILDDKGNKILDHYEIPSDFLTEKYGNYSNVSEWAAASGILSASKYDNNYDVYSGGSIKLYNPGNLETDFVLQIPFNGDTIAAGSIKIDSDRTLQWNNIEKQGNDIGVYINTKLNLIEGYGADSKKSGNVYNVHIISGNFFKVPVGESTLTTPANASISYDYLYF